MKTLVEDGSASTCTAVRELNLQDGCPYKTPAGVPSDTDLDELDTPGKKREYYALLTRYLPGVVEVIDDFRAKFPFGLVEKRDGQVVSSAKGAFHERIAKAECERDFLGASYRVHDQIARSMDVATEVWADKTNWEDPALKRLNDLVDPKRKALYGGRAAQKRIAFAMTQTTNISAGFERFMVRLHNEKYGKDPSGAELKRMHDRTLRTAIHISWLHLERTRKIRPLLGAEIPEGGIVQRYEHETHFKLEDDRLELIANTIVPAMADDPIDSSDGRIGCPGRGHIPKIWAWIEEVSDHYSYPILG